MKKAILALGFFLVVPLAAQTRHNLEITPMAGYRAGGEFKADETAILDVDADVDEGFAAGLRIDIPITHWLQVEILASRQDTELGVDGDLFGSDSRLFDVEINYYHAGVLFQWGDGQIHPFAVVTAGVGQVDPNLPGIDEEERFSMSLGGGVKVFPSEHLGLRFEARGYWTDTGNGNDDYDDCHYHDDYRYGDGDCWDYQDGLSQAEVGVGLILRF